MREAVIVDAVRTPIGKRGGGLSGVHPVDLSAHVLQALAERNDLDPHLVDDVIWGCVMAVGEQSANIGRYAALAAGWPESVPGTTIDRQCGSSQQAAQFAAAGVTAGHYDIVVAGGVESMSRVPMGSTRANGPGDAYGPMVLDRYDGGPFNQGLGAETIAERWNLTRTDLDALSLQSHASAATAIAEGRFDNEIVPVNGVTRDEGVREGGTLETLGKLATPFKPDGVVTAGSSSQISDGASALLITTPERAAELGWRPLARFHSFSVVGVDPITMLLGPIPATERILERSGLAIDDIGAFEVNEAFASVLGAWLKDTGVDPARVNPNGGAIALGHPLGASGARLATTLVHHMNREDIRYGLQTMCEGGGTANATIFELWPN